MSEGCSRVASWCCVSRECGVESVAGDECCYVCALLTLVDDEAQRGAILTNKKFKLDARRTFMS